MKIKYFIEKNRMTAPAELRGKEIIIHLKKQGGKYVAEIEIPKPTAGERLAQLKSSNKPVEHFVKKCPECGGDMIKSSPKRSGKTNAILYYRRVSCTSCPHYESGTWNVIKKGVKLEREWSKYEIDEHENKKANKYYSAHHQHRKQFGI